MSFDLHIQHAINNGMKRYQSSQDNFRKLFYDISQTLADKYYTKFQDLSVKFDKAYSKKKEVFPLIVTAVAESSPYKDQLLGNAGHGTLTMLLNHECKITIFHDDYDIVKILHRVIQASLLLFQRSFLSIGYLNMRFMDSGDLEPDKELTSDGVVVYKRLLRYSATQTLDVTPIPDADFNLPWELVPTII